MTVVVTLVPLTPTPTERTPTPHNRTPVLACAACDRWTSHTFVQRREAVDSSAGARSRHAVTLWFACDACSQQRQWGRESSTGRWR